MAKIIITDTNNDHRPDMCCLRLQDGELVAVMARHKVDSWIERHNAEIDEQRQYWPATLNFDSPDWTFDYLEVAA